jgi:uncharacterized damage-inducible protein DinB
MKLLSSLFAQKAWSNNELFHKLATVDAEPHRQTLYHAIRTLNHIYVVDRIFQAHLQGVAHPYESTHTDEMPQLGELQFNVAETDAWYCRYVSELSDGFLEESIGFRFTDGDAGRMTRGEILAHIITHGAYHRGNVGQLLKSIEVAPPRDLFTKFLHITEPARRQS